MARGRAEAVVSGGEQRPASPSARRRRRCMRSPVVRRRCAFRGTSVSGGSVIERPMASAMAGASRTSPRQLVGQQPAPAVAASHGRDREMHLRPRSVRARSDRRAAHRDHLVAQAGAVTRVAQHREVRELLDERMEKPRHCASALSKLRMPRSQRITCPLPKASRYSALMEEVGDRRCHAALEQHRLPGTLSPIRAEQGVVLHVARADLNASPPTSVSADAPPPRRALRGCWAGPRLAAASARSFNPIADLEGVR